MTGSIYVVKLPIGTKKFVRNYQVFVTTEFVITEFVITEFIITVFVITEFHCTLNKSLKIKH